MDKDIIRLLRFLELDQYDEAIRYIEKLINSNSDFIEELIYMVASKLTFEKFLFEKSFKLIQKGLTILPDSILLKLALCQNLQNHGFLKESLEMCQQLSKEHPSSGSVWRLLADLYYLYGDYEHAIEAMDFTIASIHMYDKRKSSTRDSSLTKVDFLIKNGSYHQAIDCLFELLTLDEIDDPEVELLLADCYIYLGDFEIALDFFSGITNKNDVCDKNDYYGKYFLCCLKTGKQGKAIKILTEAFEQNPRIFEYIAGINSLFYEKKETEIGDEMIINSNNLVQKFFISNTYYN